MVLLSVVVKTPYSQSDKPGSIPGHPTVNQAVICSCPALGAAKVKRRRRGDKRRQQKTDLLKSGGRKALPLPYNLCRLWDLPLPF